jgi:hypothetical protein
MAWRVERHGRRSTLIGAAHFFPRQFDGDLRRLIGEARIVLLEGPLDEEATRKVLAAGRGSGGGMLYEAAREKINAQLGRQDVWLGEEMRALKPWAAFFGVWTRYRAREGWTHSLDLDAARIAAALGKRIVYLETIEEQIAALEAVPLERILDFMNADWSAYCAAYERHYLAGELDALVGAAQAFPTYCEPIIERRDPLFAERMARELERGQACVVIGVAHCPGVLARLNELGYVYFPCP